MIQRCIQTVMDKGYWDSTSALFYADEANCNEVYSLEQFNKILSSSFKLLNYPFIKFVKDGNETNIDKAMYTITDRHHGPLKQLSFQNIMKLVESGHTLTINSLDRFCPQAKAIANQFAKIFHCRIQVNAYYSKNSQAFFEHYDTHNLFVIQVAGKKDWFWSNNAEQKAIFRTPSKDFTPPLTFENNQTLSKGDILYLPRGCWHKASATQTSSLHLSIGIHKKTYCDFVTYIASKCDELKSGRDLVGNEISETIIRQLAGELVKQLENKDFQESFINDVDHIKEESEYEFNLY